MRLSGVIHILGLLLMFLAAAMILPIPFSIYYGSEDLRALLVSSGITLASGFLLFRVTAARFTTDLRPREGFTTVAFSWIFFSAFGALPFVLSGTLPSFTDAFFETMSGFTTTGASVLTNIEIVPHGILFWRSLTHWIGGMGIIVLSLAILPFLGIGGMQLYRAELRSAADRLTPRITETAKILWGVYVAITAIEAILLMLGGMNLFEALCHSFGTLATGGYSTRNASIGAYNSAYIDCVIIVFMVAAGSNFSLHYRVARGDFRAYFRNREFLFFLSIIAIASAIISVDAIRLDYASPLRAMRDAIFQVVSIITTTGFGTADYEKWSFSSQFVLFLLMFFGACAGSTGGGIKILRIHVLIKFVYSEIERLIHPHAVIPTRIGGQAVEREVLTNVVGFFILYIVVYAIGVLLLAEMGLDMATSFGAVVATLSNIGPGLGMVGPTKNYALLPGAAKWVLSTLMLIGRLELYTVIILLAPSFWKK